MYLPKDQFDKRIQGKCRLQCEALENPCSGQPATTEAGHVIFCSSTNKDTCPVNFWCHVGSVAETTVCCPGGVHSILFHLFISQIKKYQSCKSNQFLVSFFVNILSIVLATFSAFTFALVRKI